MPMRMDTALVVDHNHLKGLLAMAELDADKATSYYQKAVQAHGTIHYYSLYSCLCPHFVCIVIYISAHIEWSLEAHTLLCSSLKKKLRSVSPGTIMNCAYAILK